MAKVSHRPAWYVTAGGKGQDWVNLLHLPYTLWNLSYVVIGAALAPRVDGQRLAGTLIAFALAVGVAAHALDELNGRPLGTTISGRALITAAAASLAVSAAIGLVGVTRLGWELVAFVAVGVLLVVGYNLELFHGRLHTDMVFAAAWGAFPLLTGYYAQTGTLRPVAVAGAVFAYGLSLAQRALSTQSRSLRRHVQAVEGRYVFKDGSQQPVDRDHMLAPIDRTLRILSWTVVALAVALLLSHVN